MVKKFGLVFLAYILVTVLVPVVALFNFARSQNKDAYLHTLAVGFDQVGGSALYGTEDYTISSYTYFLCTQGYGRRYCFYRWAIDALFGTHHCKDSFTKESSEIQFTIKEIL